MSENKILIDKTDALNIADSVRAVTNTTDKMTLLEVPEKLNRISTSVIDQTYDPTSENAQSGKAVAEAVETKMDSFGTVSPDKGTITLNGECSGTRIVSEGGASINFDNASGQLTISSGNSAIWLSGSYRGTETPAIVSNVAVPEDDTDVANKKYVDESLSAAVDQTYIPDSENAQSGKAVAEAVATEQKRSDNTFANALKGSKSGSAILIDDVSPVTHEMGVKVRSKNLFDYSVLENADYITVNDRLTGEFVFKKVSGLPEVPIPAKENTSYYVSGYVKGVIEGQSISCAAYYTDGSNTNFNATTVLDSYVRFSGVTRIDKTLSYIKFGASGGIKVGTSFKNVQVELNSETAYTPYVPDLTAVNVTR